MARYLLDIAAGCFRPCWTDNAAVGFLVGYLDAHDKSPAEGQMVKGYLNSAGCAPYEWPPVEWNIDENGNLISLKYDEVYDRVSECTAGDGSKVVMFEAALTAVIRDDKIVWLARLD